MVTGLSGDFLTRLAAGVLGRFNSDPALVYEPFSYDSMRTANQMLFNRPVVPTLAMMRIGEDPASIVYLRKKAEASAEPRIVTSESATRSIQSWFMATYEFG